MFPMALALVAQLFEERLRVSQVSAVEALSEAVVDFREHRVGLIGVRFAGS